MENSLLSLKHEVKSTKDLRTCLETLIKIFRNTVNCPEENKFRTLRTGNKTFSENVWRFKAGQQFLINCGWILEGENLVLPPKEDLTVPLFFLVENRDVKPSSKEWVTETKHVIPNADKEKERQLRQEALAKKEKEMIDLKKDMAECEAIKARILAEHRHDKEKRMLPVRGSSQDLDQPALVGKGVVTTPQRFSSSNVLGGTKGPVTSPLLTAGERDPPPPHPMES